MQEKQLPMKSPNVDLWQNVLRGILSPEITNTLVVLCYTVESRTTFS